MVFNCLCISQASNSSIHINRKTYMSNISLIVIYRDRLKQQNEKGTKKELNSFLALTQLLNIVIQFLLVQTAFSASHLQQSLGYLADLNLVTPNNFIMKLKALSPKSLYIIPKKF